MARAFAPNPGRMPVAGSTLVIGRYRGGVEFGPVEARSRRWSDMPKVSPYDFDIVEWRRA
jgi:hypothetical protein